MTVSNARTLLRAGISSPDALAQSNADAVAHTLAAGLAKVSTSETQHVGHMMAAAPA